MVVSSDHGVGVVKRLRIISTWDMIYQTGSKICLARCFNPTPNQDRLNTMNRRSVSLLLPAVGLLIACNSSEPQQPSSLEVTRTLAVVGNDSIDVAQFIVYSASLPEAMKSGPSPAAGRRRVLETLIDKTLLLAEARATGLEQDAEFVDRLEEFRQARIIESYRRRHIAAQIRVSTAEMEELWRSSHRDRALRFGGVMVETMAEALEVKALLEAGASLKELAATRSLHQASAATGGQLAQYLPKSQVVAPIAEAIFHLEVGGVSEPVLVRGEDEGPQSLAVFKVMDEIEAPLTLSEGAIQQELATAKMAVRSRILRDSLITQYDARTHVDAIRLVAQRSAEIQTGPVTVTAADSGRVIASYRGGEITIGEFLVATASLYAAANTLLDTSKVAILLRDNILPSYLSLEEASAQGLDRDPALLQKVSRKKEELLLSLLRYRHVDRHVAASDEEARTYFEANPDLFKRPGKTELVEILVDSQDLAQQLKDQIEAGADPQALARTHTLREELRATGGVVDINQAQLANYKDIFVSAQRSPLGSVQGPVATHDGYFSVFKILERTYVHPSFEEASVRAAAFVRIRKAKTGYVRYVQSLREKYPVRILDDELADLTQGTS